MTIAGNIPEDEPGDVGDNTADREGLVSIETLPNEILSQIFEYLDRAPPSYNIDELHDEPHFDITKSGDSPLKACSLVSKRWRDASKSGLFKHTQFIVRKHATRSIMLTQQIKPFLNFLVSNSLRNVISFSLLVYDNKITDNPKGERRHDDFADFWSSFFQTIDPINLLIVAPPEALGALTSCRIILTDAWNFDCPCHYLRLQRIPGSGQGNAPKLPSDSEAGGAVPRLSGPSVRNHQRDPDPKSPTLFDLRAWDKLLLNEGSFIKAYATYEFWLRKAPSVCDAPSLRPHITDREIRSFRTSSVPQLITTKL